MPATVSVPEIMARNTKKLLVDNDPASPFLSAGVKRQALGPLVTRSHIHNPSMA